MDVITNLVAKGNSFLWSFLLIVLLCGTGIYYTIRLRFIQVRKFGEGWKLVFGHLSLNGEKHEKGEMTPFQSIATAIAAQVGTGNLAGAATALLGGGPGAIFWMWVSAFFGMSTIYAEATLAQNFKTEVNGEVTGGPVYYITTAFKGSLGKFLAGFFAVAITLALGFFGCMVQSNSIGDAFGTAFGINPWIVGIIIAAISLFVFVGGISRIASLTEKIVPIMAAFYIVGALIVIFYNWRNIPYAFHAIVVGAFNPAAISGGAVGATVKLALTKGVARGLFSNEAGMGSTPHAHAVAKVQYPAQQGLMGIVSVFIDTFIVLNLTVFSVLTTGAMDSGKGGIALTQEAFMRGFGNFGDIFVAICLLFFAFSTVLSWHFFGQINVQYLFGKKAVKVYSIIVVAFIIVGSTLKVDLVWELADFFNGLMVIPNAMALLALSGVVVGISKKYGKK